MASCPVQLPGLGHCVRLSKGLSPAGFFATGASSKVCLQIRTRWICCSTSNGALGDATSSSDTDLTSSQRPIPWNLTFDLRERETIWTDENKARLVQLVAARELGLDKDIISYRLRQLTLLLPDLSGRVASMKPALLADILRDPTAVAERCVGLRDALPFANVSRLVAGQPELLLQEVDSVVADIGSLGDLLSIDQRHTQELVTQEPRFLDVEGVSEVLEEMQRLMPKADPKAVLLRDPSWLMRVERGVKRLGSHPDDI